MGRLLGGFANLLYVGQSSGFVVYTNAGLEATYPLDDLVHVHVEIVTEPEGVSDAVET